MHVNQQGTMKISHRKYFCGCLWNWGQHDSLSSTCLTIRGNDKTVPAVHSSIHPTRKMWLVGNLGSLWEAMFAEQWEEEQKENCAYNEDTEQGVEI